MLRKLHLLAAILATLCMTSFLTSTIIAELLGSAETIATIKHWVVTPGLFLLIPLMVLTGGTGFASGKHRQGRLINQKKKRMPLIAANGLFVLVPCAIFLDQRAASATFDTAFYVVQCIELIAGATNLTLMALNIRDGLTMTGKLTHKPA